MFGPLNHLRVVEGSAFVAAPLAGLTLAQAGADVIRFDPPGGGLDYGRWPLAPGTGRSLFWTGLNKGKRSLCVDIRRPEGRELVQDLIAAPGEGGGLLLTNFAGMPWLADEVLRARRADVIKLEIAGNFDGSNAVDYTVNPAVGLPAMTGTGGPNAPTNHVLPAWDVACGLTAAFGLVSAVLERARTGQGRSISLALSDVAFATVGHLGMLAEAALGGVDRPPSGNDLYGAFGRDFPTADGRRVMIVALTRKQWSGLVKVCGIADAVTLLEERLGADLSEEGARYLHRDAIAALVAPWVAARPLAEVAAAFDAAGVSWGPYQTMTEALARDPRVSTANPLFTAIEQPGVGSVLAAGSPLAAAGEARSEARSAPSLGADNDAILGDVLGLSSGAIGKLYDAGIVAREGE
ncbi:2-methylfumaryl-CoA isomerase [Thalassobaculum fulvum]|uniref:2-methylfumaryl-CoA isomerase n=1 Tax=Thalassobaculum fulvum TaxID=1633335 RepID=A0A918XST6_9PROT|nr:CoA transferase [Thalassobaculum fulvum]GHD53000.1 2-methylfumaryl-CoA isomerase [Thalassobaculum fulvum]